MPFSCAGRMQLSLLISLRAPAQSSRGTPFSTTRRAGHPSAFADIPPLGDCVYAASATIFHMQPCAIQWGNAFLHYSPCAAWRHNSRCEESHFVHGAAHKKTPAISILQGTYHLERGSTLVAVSRPDAALHYSLLSVPAALASLTPAFRVWHRIICAHRVFCSRKYLKTATFIRP